MSVGNKGDSMTVMFCPTHLSTFLSTKDETCAWGKVVDPCPRRSACEKHRATVILGYGIRVWDMEDDDDAV